MNHHAATQPHPTFFPCRIHTQSHRTPGCTVAKLLALLAASILLSACQATSERVLKGSDPAITGHLSPSALNQATDIAVQRQTGSVLLADNYHPDMADSELGTLTEFEHEMASADEFFVFSYEYNRRDDQPPARFEDAFKKQRFNRAAIVFETEIGMQHATQQELLHQIDTLYNIGAHGKSLATLQALEAKIRREFDQITTGQYEKNVWGNQAYETGIIWAYANMLAGYARYYEVLGDYRRAIHLTRKSRRMLATKDGMWLDRFNLLNDISMARLSGLTGDRDQVARYFKQIRGYHSPAVLKLGGGENSERWKIDGMISATLALKDYAAADKLLAERYTTTEGELRIPGLMWGFGVMATVLMPAVGAVVLTDYLLQDKTLTDVYETDSYQQAKAVRQAFIPSKVAFEMGSYEVAKQGYDALLDSRVVGEQQVLYYTMLHDRGMIALHEGDPAAAKDYLVDAINILESQRSSFNTEASKIGFVGDKQAIYFSLIKLLIESDHIDEALQYVERSKARALVDMLAQKDMSVSRKIKNEYRQKLQDYNAGQQVIDQADFTVVPSQRALQIKASSQATRALQQAVPELASLVSVEVPSVKALQALMAPDETLIEYYGSGQALYGFVLTQSSVSAVKLDGRQLSDTVAAFRLALSNPDNRSYRHSGRQLYRRLLEPLEPYITNRKLAIVPHGPLHYLPFAALVADDTLHALDAYQIRTLPSASIMRFLTSRPSNGRYMLALGNPDLNQAKLDLPGAQSEVEAIARDRDGIDSYVRKAATESLIKGSASEYQRLHIASHGVFHADRPLQSALLLAADDANNGQLTLSEIYDLDLNADLVTLSACETGLGKISNGDDVIGLNRGFMYAGASTIISSLWQVSDSATAELMQLFYQYVGNDKREALHNAQMAVKQTYTHPYYWAAFQLSGAAD